MTCRNCGAEAEPGQKFCLECGARLAGACPACGAILPPTAKFCGECGTPAGAGLPSGEGAVAPATSPAPVAERRLVSVLFADLVGFTPFAEERDPEEVRETLSGYFDLARRIVERYGGTVEKFIGDAVMAAWGTPTSHEDDAERAVRAGLDLVDSVTTLGPGISARAAILTGEAAVTLGATNQGMVAGDLVNTASRLQAAAPAGSVLVGEATMRAASGAVVFESAGDQALKGKAAPVPAWRAVRVVAERGGRGRSDILEAPFVGRDAEFRLLKDLFHATSADRRIRLVSVTGEAGIGKSRLAWEFEKYLDGLVETVYWHHGRSPSYGTGITFWALGEMVRGRAGLAETDDDATTRTKVAECVARWIPDEGERRWIEPALLALLGSGSAPAGGQEQLFAAWRTFFERIAAQGTVAMVFEDVQWADTGLLAFIDHLVEWSRSVPIFVVALARPELLEARADWGAGKRNFTSLGLEPLAGEAMHELIRGLVPGLPDAARSRIVERAGGIPLYAVETVRMLVTDGRLVANGGAYRMAGELADIAIPETLHSLISARLDALEPTDRSLVQAAAVLGQSFTPAALAAVSGQPAGELEPRLRSLARREILVHDADPRSPERGQYTFVQALVREVAYATLAKRDRKVRHVAAARYFESLGEDELVGALAAQYLAAHQNAPEGPEAEALATQARIALRAAGDRAESLGSPEQAAQFFESALDVTSDDRERAALLERAGTAADTAARHAVAQGHLERAVEFYRTLGDRSATARATAILGRVIIHSFRLQEALAVLRAAAEEFVDLDSDPGLPRLLGQQARAEMLLQLDLEAAIRTCDRALALAERLDLVEVVADVLVTRGTALSGIGRSYEGTGAIEAGLRLATAYGLVDTELRARTNISAPLGLQDQRAALEVARSGLAIARRIGNRGATALLLGNLAAAALETGDWDQAAEELRGAIATFDGAERTVLLFFLAGFAAARGELTADQIAELDGRIEEAVREGRSGWENSRHGVRAIAAETEGRFGNIAGEMIDSARTDPFNAPATLSDAAIYALLAEDANRAREALDLLDKTGGHGQVISLARRACAAGLAGLDGRMAEAKGGLIEAYEGYRATGMVRKQVLTGLLAATLLDRDDPRVGAVTAETRAVLERLRARPYLAALDAAVVRGTGRTTASAAPTPLEAHSQAARPA